VKISIEEVSRVLANTPLERDGQSHAVVTVRESSERETTGREAALVDVSPTAQEVNQIRQHINRLPDVREDRVRALKEQIENGTYQVSGQEIADLIIRRALADNTMG
jgi:negative regulator of flagellin synthesis FlgM